MVPLCVPMPTYEVCTHLNALEKCFKICYILYKREATKKNMGFLIHMANFEMFFRALSGEQISFF